MQSLIEKLNTPAAVITVLAVILLANGFLFYQSRSSSPEDQQVSSQTNQPEDQSARNDGGSDGEEATTSQPDTETSEMEQSNARPEPATREGSNPDNEGSSRDGAGENTENTENTGTSGGDGGGSGREDAPADENVPAREEAPDLLAGLGDSISSCGGSVEEEERCIRSFVGEVAPDSQYVGGRVDLAPRLGGVNTEVIYFEDPGLDACQFERAEYDGEENRYAVILVGAGSFSDERGDQCIPQA